MQPNFAMYLDKWTVVIRFSYWVYLFIISLGYLQLKIAHTDFDLVIIFEMYYSYLIVCIFCLAYIVDPCYTRIFDWVPVRL